jgi:hypothetical protein
MRHLPNKIAVAILGLSLLIGVSMAAAATAQAQQPYRVSDRQISDLLRRLERNSERFRRSLDASLDRSRRDGTQAEDEINAFVRDFDNAVEQLRDRFNGRRSVAGDVETVLQKAVFIDNFVGSPAAAGARNDWSLVKTDLDALATAYGVRWQWNRRTNDGFGNRDRNRDGRNWDTYGNYGGSLQLRQTALNAGYNEGFKVGANDRSRNRSSNFSNSSVYQKATADYSSRLGNRELYRRYYREGFQTGYNDGYGTPAANVEIAVPGNRRGRNWDRYGTYGGSFQLRQTALNAGYNEGIKVGRDDRQKNRSSNFRNSSEYQKATEDYSSGLGDRELYRRYYREGFENGYYDGYNGN